MILTKVSKIGEAYYHYFRAKDGSEFRVETTKEDYEQLGQPNPKNPIMDGAEWVGSTGGVFVFDTPDGRLKDNQYAEIETYKVVKLPGRPEKSVPNESITVDGIYIGDSI